MPACWATNAVVERGPCPCTSDTERGQVLHPKGLGTRQLLVLNHDALNPHKNALNKRNAAHVHIGPDRISIKYTTNIRREETRKWLHASEVIGADIQHVVCVCVCVCVCPYIYTDIYVYIYMYR